MKKIITFSLALIMLLTTLAACAAEKKTEKPNQDGDKNTVEKQWTKKEYDFDGYVFTIVSRANTKNVIGFNGSDIDAEELTGNEVLDEVYNRNRLIETTYNCVIEQNDADGSAAAIKTLLTVAKNDLAILHPLPRVNEISVAVDDDPRACYFRQVLYGKYIRMALVMMLLEVNV